nr:hypothetical protein [Saprospiraceae bacterium]
MLSCPFKFFLFLVCAVFLCIVVTRAQSLDTPLDSLGFYGDIMSNARMDKHKVIAAEQFNVLFSKILNADDSVDKLSEIPFISTQIPADSSFAIYSWRLALANNSEFYYFGYIHSPIGEFQPIQLVDGTNSGRVTEYSTLTPNYWPAAFYYGMKSFELPDGKTAFLLFGVNEHSRFNRIRMMDVLYREGNDFYFGYPVFGDDPANIPRRGRARIMLKYTYDAPLYLNYDSEYELVVMNKLEERKGPHPNQGVTGIPFGEYHGFRYEDGYWIYVPEVVREIPTPDSPPVKKKRDGPKRDLFGRPIDK